MSQSLMSVIRHSRLAIIAVLSIFIVTAFNKYLFLEKGFPINPYVYVIFLFVVVWGSAIGDSLKSLLVVRKFIAWLLFYFLVSIAWILVSGGEEYSISEMQSRLIIIILMLSGIRMIKLEGIGLYVKAAIAAGFIVSCVNGFIEFNSPFFFMPPESQFSNPGRSSGFFMNANRAATFLSLLTLASVAYFSSRWRLLIIALGSLSVLITWSRGGIACHVLLLFLLPVVGLITWRQFAWLAGGGVLLVVNMALLFALMPGREMGVNIDNVYNRAAFFLGGDVSADASVNERLHVAGKSLEYFSESPFLGNGTGFAVGWGEAVSPHNQYLFYMVDHGVIGAFIFPLFLLCLYAASAKGDKGLALVVAVYLLARGMFTHNVLDEQGVVLLAMLIAFRSSVEPVRGMD